MAKKITLSHALTILNVAMPISFTEVKRAYKIAALNSHPDKNGSTVSMAEVNTAWGVIKANKEHFVNTAPTTEVEAYTLDPMHSANVPSFSCLDTLIKQNWKIVNTCSELVYDYYKGEMRANPWLFYGTEKEVYIKDEMLLFSMNWSNRHAAIEDVTNALHTGKACRQYSFYFKGSPENFLSKWQDFVGSINVNSPVELYNYLEAINQDTWITNEYGDTVRLDLEEFDLNISRVDAKSKNNFSPLNLAQLKPLTSAPKKWTVSHLRRLLANGQFCGLIENFSIKLDDAMYDTENTYIRDPIAMLEDDYKGNLSVYSRTHEDGSITLNFSHHNNESRSLTVRLDNRYPIIDIDVTKNKDGVLQIAEPLCIEAKAPTKAVEVEAQNTEVNTVVTPDEKTPLDQLKKNVNMETLFF